jgi:hypothetical protein
MRDDHPLPLLGLKEPVGPGLAILGELQQEFLLVATMGDVPRMTGYGMPVRSGNAGWTSCLKQTISAAKGHPKLESHHFRPMILRELHYLAWSDPVRRAHNQRAELARACCVRHQLSEPGGIRVRFMQS